ncbi:MAG TPA: hypothetical protein VN947_20750 [Polyangia bacterium]|nr:hypothetical protein [Polyangia bacterium]
MTKHHRLRWLWLIPGCLVVLVVLVLIFLNPIVTYGTQKGLDRIAGASGTFKSLSVTIIHPGYDLYGLKVQQMPVEKHKEPLFYADRIEMRWSWRAIFHGHLMRRVKIWNARVMVPMRPGDESKPSQPPLEIAKTLESVPSAGLERLEMVNSQIILVDEMHDGERIWVHDLSLTVENMASRKKLMKGLPLLVTLRGKLQNTGELTAFLTMDPFDKGLTFAGSVELRHLALADLHQFTSIKGLKLPDGSIDVFASVTCKRGELTGGVKPILKNVKVAAADNKLGDKIKAALADVAVKILSDRVPGRNAVATIIPIHGDLKKPDVQLVPTVLAVLRNAFVEGLSASLTNVPPPVGQGGFFHQARQALSKKSKHPVEAKPNK